MLDSENITFKERNMFIPIPIANYIDFQEFPSNNDSNNLKIQLQTINNSVTALNSLNYTSLDDYNPKYDEEQVTGLSRMMDQAGVRYMSYSDYQIPYQRRTKRKTDDASTSAPQQPDA
ncbi:hypothetical protein Tco_0518905 [Tanacetum coccineum]